MRHHAITYAVARCFVTKPTRAASLPEPTPNLSSPASLSCSHRNQRHGRVHIFQFQPFWGLRPHISRLVSLSQPPCSTRSWLWSCQALTAVAVDGGEEQVRGHPAPHRGRPDGGRLRAQGGDGAVVPGLRRGACQEPLPVHRPVPAQPHEANQRVPPRRRRHPTRPEDCVVRRRRSGGIGEPGVRGGRHGRRRARVGGLHAVHAVPRRAHVQGGRLRGLPAVPPRQRAGDQRHDGVRGSLRGRQGGQRVEGVRVGRVGLRRHPRRPVRQARRMLRRRLRRDQSQGRSSQRKAGI